MPLDLMSLQTELNNVFATLGPGLRTAARHVRIRLFKRIASVIPKVWFAASAMVNALLHALHRLHALHGLHCLHELNRLNRLHELNR